MSETNEANLSSALRRIDQLEFQVAQLRKAALAARMFRTGGVDYHYVAADGNRTYDNERAVELPVVESLVTAHDRPEETIEVGNVLHHYFPHLSHRVIDKYEDHRTVTWNEDVVDFRPPVAPSLVVSVSTLEHVGYAESPRDLSKFGRAVDNLISWLAPGGRLVFTVPLGYNPAVLKFLDDPPAAVTDIRVLRRTTVDNLWGETRLELVRDLRYGTPFPAANAVAIVTANVV